MDAQDTDPGYKRPQHADIEHWDLYPGHRSWPTKTRTRSPGRHTAPVAGSWYPSLAAQAESWTVLVQNSQALWPPWRCSVPSPPVARRALPLSPSYRSLLCPSYNTVFLTSSTLVREVERIVWSLPMAPCGYKRGVAHESSVDLMHGRRLP